MMKVLVVDDEPLARDRLSRMISKLEGYEVIGEAENGQKALALNAQLQPDIMCLDIRMPGMDGLEVAQALQAETQADEDHGPSVIFCTAYGEYALQAFEANAVDYLLKPVNQEKLSHALLKARRLSSAQLDVLRQLGADREGTDTEGAQEGGAMIGTAAESALDQSPACITVRRRSGLHRILLKDIRALVADNKYVSVFHLDGEDLIDESLKQIEARFPDVFVRVHRNALVSLPHVVSMSRDGLGCYQLSLQGVEVQPVVSRRHVSTLRQQIEAM
jgi:two-component system response regulator AlgR